MPGTSEDEAIGGAQAEIQPSPSADGGTKEAPAPKDVEQHLPSGEDLRTLRRVADHIPPKLFTIAFIELCERFSYYGTTIVYTNFIQQALPAGSRTGAGGAHGQSGALGMGQQASTAVTTFNQFWQYFMPLFGAYVAGESNDHVLLLSASASGEKDKEGQWGD